MPRITIQALSSSTLFLFPVGIPPLTAEAPLQQPDEQLLKNGEIFIYKLKPESADGRGYKLTYQVAAPLEVFWRFKTDFEKDNDIKAVD